MLLNTKIKIKQGGYSIQLTVENARYALTLEQMHEAFELAPFFDAP